MKKPEQDLIYKVELLEGLIERQEGLLETSNRIIDMKNRLVELCEEETELYKKENKRLIRMLIVSGVFVALSVVLNLIRLSS